MPSGKSNLANDSHMTFFSWKIICKCGILTLPCSIPSNMTYIWLIWCCMYGIFTYKHWVFFLGTCCKYSSTVEHQSDLYLSLFILPVAMCIYIYIVVIIIIITIVVIDVYCYYHYFYFYYYYYLCMIVSLFIYPSIYPSAYNDNIWLSW